MMDLSPFTKRNSKWYVSFIYIARAHNDGQFSAAHLRKHQVYLTSNQQNSPTCCADHRTNNWVNPCRGEESCTTPTITGTQNVLGYSHLVFSQASPHFFKCCCHWCWGLLECSSFLNWVESLQNITHLKVIKILNPNTTLQTRTNLSKNANGSVSG